MERFEDLARKNNPSPTGYIIQDRIAYINLPGFVASDNEEIKAFASTIDGIILDLGKQRPCGWIVDLRSNTGGNMWPMLAGIGPVLGEGKVGGFIFPNGKEVSWFYKER